MNEVYISLTTIPTRFTRVIPIINALKNQSYSPSKIILFIPHNYLRFPEFKSVSIPHKLLDLQDDLFEIHRCKDYGTPTKFFPFLQQEGLDKILITVDDDIIPSHNLVRDLVRAHKTWPTDIFGLMGVLHKPLPLGPFNLEFVHCQHLFQPVLQHLDRYQVSSCGGYRGVLYPPHVFQSDIFHLIPNLALKHYPLPIMDDDRLLEYYWDQNNQKSYVAKSNIGLILPRTTDGVSDSQQSNSMRQSQNIINEFFACSKIPVP